jgi:hypothetical protein
MRTATCRPITGRCWQSTKSAEPLRHQTVSVNRAFSGGAAAEALAVRVPVFANTTLRYRLTLRCWRSFSNSACKLFKRLSRAARSAAQSGFRASTVSPLNSAVNCAGRILAYSGDNDGHALRRPFPSSKLNLARRRAQPEPGRGGRLSRRLSGRPPGCLWNGDFDSSEVVF